MLSTRALRAALLDLAESGRVCVTDVDAALQIADAWSEDTSLIQASSHWIVRSPPEPARRRGAGESPGPCTNA